MRSTDKKLTDTVMKDGKYRITILSPHKLTFGGGVERFILNIVQNAPVNNFDIVVVQTDSEDMQRFDNGYVNQRLSKVKLCTLKSFRRIQFSAGNAIEEHLESPSSIPIILAWQLVKFLFCLFYRPINRSVLQQINESDLVYLIHNSDKMWLKSRSTTLIGSTHEHDFWPSRMTSGLMYKVFCMLRYKGIAGFHFISARSFREAIIHRKYDFVLENGVDTKLFFPVDCSDSVGAGRIEFLFVSRLEATKGVKRLVYAWKLAGLRDVKLHIVGKGSLENFVRENASTGIGIVYHGGLAPSELAALYRRCDVFIFPTSHETYGNVVLEALASGLYVIASDALIGLFDEFNKLGVLEYVPNDTSVISEAMIRSVKNIRQIRQNRLKAYNYIMQLDRDWNSVTISLFERFERILNSSRVYEEASAVN